MPSSDGVGNICKTSTKNLARKRIKQHTGGRVGESIKASLGYRPSSSGPEFDSQVSIVAPTPGHAPLHIQFTRFRRSFTVPPYTEFHITNSTTLLMVRKGFV